MKPKTPKLQRRSRLITSSERAAYAAGDRVKMLKKTIWGCQTGTVHSCNGQWLNVRLDNNRAILSLNVSDVQPQ